MVPPSPRKSEEFANSHTKEHRPAKPPSPEGCNEDLGGFFVNLKIAGCIFGRFKIGAAPAVDILKITFFLLGTSTVPVQGELSRKTMRKNLR